MTTAGPARHCVVASRILVGSVSDRGPTASGVVALAFRPPRNTLEVNLQLLQQQRALRDPAPARRPGCPTSPAARPGPPRLARHRLPAQIEFGTEVSRASATARFPGALSCRHTYFTGGGPGGGRPGQAAAGQVRIQVDLSSPPVPLPNVLSRHFPLSFYSTDLIPDQPAKPAKPAARPRPAPSPIGPPRPAPPSL